MDVKVFIHERNERNFSRKERKTFCKQKKLWVLIRARTDFSWIFLFLFEESGDEGCFFLGRKSVYMFSVPQVSIVSFEATVPRLQWALWFVLPLVYDKQSIQFDRLLWRSVNSFVLANGKLPGATGKLQKSRQRAVSNYICFIWGKFINYVTAIMESFVFSIWCKYFL